MTSAGTRTAMRPELVVFDVLGSTFSLDRLKAPVAATGLPEDAVEAWVASTLRDGFGLSAAGAYAPLADVATSALEGVLAKRGLPADAERVKAAVRTFRELDAFPDARPAFERLREHDVTVATMSNGGVDGSRALLDRAGLADLVDAVHGVDEVRRWKPARDPYLHVARAHDAPPDRVALVAAHGWDVMGAREAGLVTGYVARGSPFPAALGAPDVSGDGLVEVVDALLALPAEAERARAAET